jgi:SAM-dependent methyltransferase
MTGKIRRGAPGCRRHRGGSRVIRSDDLGCAAVKHPIFARLFVLLTRLGGEDLARYRDEALAPASGRVIEVGAGHGENFSRYPTVVTEVIAVEPEPYLRGKAEEAAAAARVPVRVVDGHAEALPVEDGEFDCAIASLVLCSVPDQAAALAEMRRVLKPGGQLIFYEHVVSEEPRLARLQRRMNPVWTRMAGGCNLHRDTAAAIAAAGFDIERVRAFDMPKGGPAKPHVIGVAIRS